MNVPAARVTPRNVSPARPDGDYVLYWMVGARRTAWNFGLDHAIRWARHLHRPLVIFEPLRVDPPWASARIHRFVLDGMAANAAACAGRAVRYVPWVELRPGGARGVLEALAARACVIVTDHQPGFFLTRMQDAAAARLGVLLERVDGVGLIPLEAPGRAYPSAYAYRRFLQRSIRDHLGGPTPDPLAALDLPVAGDLPIEATPTSDLVDPAFLDRLPVDRTVWPVAERGGAPAAHDALDRFLDDRLDRTLDDRHDPSHTAQSGLSAWLHFGHLGVHEVFEAVTRHEGWSPARLGAPTGSREGFWGLSPAAEAFLDELVVWREVCHLFAHHHPDHDRYAAQPAWALATLDRHRADPRPVRYDLETLEAAATHDEIWNAAQRQLRGEGRIHNALRMVWGKKILEWSDSPESAWEVALHLNNRWALDGRDANSTGGIGWVFGRFDRPWGPERPIYGLIRYMSSERARKKLRLDGWLARWGA